MSMLGIATSWSGPPLAGLAAIDNWIGLEAATATKDAAAFEWITGESVTVKHWGATEPNATGPCAALVNGTFWADRPCGDAYLAICERP